MTVIRPNSVSGINSITAQANEIKIFKSDGTQGGLVIGGANLNATSGISTVAALTVTGNVSVGGTLTYQDVTNIDSVGIVTARAGVHVTGGNVAVGHNNPSVNLHVKGSASNGQIYLGGTGAHSQIYADNDGVLILNADQGNSAANSYLGFNVDNSEKLRIDSSGNLTAVNTSSGGATTLKVGANATSGVNNGTIIINNGGTGDAALQFDYENSAARAKIYVYRSEQELRFDTAGSERLRITSGGDVLISDTTNSVYNDTSGGGINLKENGQIVTKKESTSTADPLVWLNDTGQTTNRTIALAQDGTERGYLGLTGTNLSLGVNGGDRLLITDAGMVGINMTPSTVGSSTYMLQMYNAGSQCFMSLGEGSGGNGPLNGLVIGVSNAAHYIVGRENRPMIFSTNDTERLRIATDGDLTLTGSDNVEIKMKCGTSSGNNILAFLNSAGTTRGNITYDSDNNFLLFNVNQAERLRITSAGELLISNSGNRFLSLDRTNASSGSGEFNINVESDSQASISFDDGAPLVIGTSSSPRTQAGFTERLRITSDGAVRIGNSLTSNAAGRFQVVEERSTGDDNDCNAYFETNRQDWNIKTYYNRSGTHYHLVFVEQNVERGSIRGNDGSNVTFNQGSDYRWKENIVEMTGAEGIEICKRLKPSKYNWIENREQTGEINTVDGFIAHEVVEAGVLGAVVGEKDAVNEDGSIKGQLLDYGQMTPVLAAGIKGLIAKVETLETQNADLLARVTALEG